MSIFYIRHGEKIFENGKGIPRFDPEIKHVNVNLKKFLPENPDIIISSPFRRCRETAETFYPDHNIYYTIRYGEYLGHWKYIKEEDFDEETIKKIKEENYSSNLDKILDSFSKETIQNFKKRLRSSSDNPFNIYDSIVIITHGFCLSYLYTFFSKNINIKTTLFFDDPKDGFKIEYLND